MPMPRSRVQSVIGPLLSRLVFARECSVFDNNIIFLRKKMDVTVRKQHVTDEELRELVPDLPKGPLDNYRKKASFDWRRMKLAYESVNTIKFKVIFFYN